MVAFICIMGILLINLNIIDSITTKNLTVNRLGIAIGKLEESKWSGRKFYSFRGIPYAIPPIGNLRYAPPVPITSWTNEYLDATNFRNICPQNKQEGYDVEGYDEDCLHLNVYAPAVGLEKKNHQTDVKSSFLPVMIWIHGGYFMSGHAQRFEPYYLMESDVVLVVPQFRLGPFGLLCLMTEEIPGNVQFLDQIMAMQWVQDNIKYFGGDKNRVTLFGQSSGGYSVNLHLLSPLSKGLFHQTIIQSNSVYTSGMIDKNPVETGREIGKILDCDIQTIESITQCMKTLPVKTILDGIDKYIAANSANGRNNWGGNRAVVQKSDGVRFLTEEPEILIKNGHYAKLAMMGGTTSQEGSFVVSAIYDMLSATKLLEDSEFLKDKLIPMILNYFAIEDETGGLSHILMEKYFPNKEAGDFLKMVSGLTDMSSVLLFKAGIHRMLNENRRVQSTYLYNFEYRGSQTRFGYESNKEYPFDGGVAHSDDNIYLFPFPDKLNTQDTLVAKNIIQLWTSFATNGIPSINGIEIWPKMSTKNGPYLKIGSDIKIGDNYFHEYNTIIRKIENSKRSSSDRKTNTWYICSFIELIKRILMPLL